MRAKRAGLEPPVDTLLNGPAITDDNPEGMACHRATVGAKGRKSGAHDHQPSPQQPARARVTAVRPQPTAQPQASAGFGVPEGKAGGSDNPLTATPGGSNLGKVFGGGQRMVVIQQAPEQAGQEGKKDDLPPPK